MFLSILGLAAIVAGFLLVVDPYDTLPFSPDFEREPISTNTRFSFPALAMKLRFDSAIFGTSTNRLLRPADLNSHFGARFVNLSMNSATTYEQLKIFDLFIDHHPQPKAVILGIDSEWCTVGEDPALFTVRPFPPWLYDGDPWNDALYLFNFSALEQAGRQAAQLVGLRKHKYGLDGYTNFLPPQDEYDKARAVGLLYGDGIPRRRKQVMPAPRELATARSSMRFPTHRRLRHMLARLPAETVKVVLFVPYHHFHQPAPGSMEDARWRECKRRVAAIFKPQRNAHVMDFMIHSKITLVDSNYWDPLHFNIRVAGELAGMIAAGVRTGTGRDGYFNYLTNDGEAVH
ncbi:MAG: hypothetical protein HQ514_15025 [Rhodospirillales bacterium]|nr:hypothetical protein [Rhodospirillales bacterium]